jgi:hypothetical protein
VVGGCKELSAGGDSCLCLIDCRREFFIAADAWENTRHGVGCNSLLGRNAGDIIMQLSMLSYNNITEYFFISALNCSCVFTLSLNIISRNDPLGSLK